MAIGMIAEIVSLKFYELTELTIEDKYVCLFLFYFKNFA